jgi:hypothetical protein
VSILAAVGAECLQRRGGVAGEAVIELVDQAREPAAVHRTEDQLPVQGTQQQQVVQDVRGGQDPVHVRVGQRDPQTVQQLAAVRHRHGIAADGEGAAGRVVRGHDEVLNAVLEAGMAAACLRGPGDRVRILQADGAQVLITAGIVIHRGG